MITTCLLAAVLGQSISAEPEYELGKRIIMPIDVGEVESTTQTKVKIKVTPQVDAVQRGEELLLWALPGTHTVEVDIVQVDFELRIFEWFSEEITFTVKARGPPGPGPDPDDPDPIPPGPVPPDEFGNLGQQVHAWATEMSLTHRQEVATIYRQAAASLLTVDPNVTMTIGESAAWIKEEKGRLPAGVQAQYRELSGKVAPIYEEHLRSNMTRQRVAAFYQAFARGLAP